MILMDKNLRETALQYTIAQNINQVLVGSQRKGMEEDGLQERERQILTTP